MKRLFTALLLTLLIAPASFARQTQTPSANADSPAVRRAKEWAQFVNSGKLAEARKYIQENYAPSFLNVPMDQHLNFIARSHDLSRGFEFQRVQEEKPNEAVVVFRNKLTGGLNAFLVRVEPESPHRITGIGQRRVNQPADAKPAVKLTEDRMAAELDAFITKLAGADVFSGAVLFATD